MCFYNCLLSNGIGCLLKVNPFPDNKFLDFSKLKEFADDNLILMTMAGSSQKRVENIVGKGEIAHSPFHTLFLKDLYSRHIKTRACLGKGQANLPPPHVLFSDFVFIWNFAVTVSSVYNSQSDMDTQS